MTIIHSSDLGWTAGQDISDEFAALVSTFKEGDTFVFDHMYEISGSRLQLPDNFTLAGGAQGAGLDVVDSGTNNAPLFFLGHGNTLIDLTVKHSNSPNSGTESLNPQKGRDWDGKYGFSSRDKDDISVLNSYFEGNISVLLDIHGGSNLLIEDTEFNGGNTQLRLLGDVDSPTIHNSLFQNALSDGIKTLKGSNAEHTKDAVVSESVFLNNNRDGIDTTGGFRNSTVTDSFFVGNWAGLDIKDIYDSSDDFALGGPVNQNILITNTEFIDHPNAIVVTTLDRTGGNVLNNTNASQWVAQDIRLEDSIVEQSEAYSGFSRIFLIKSSDDVTWSDVQALGGVGVPPRLQNMGFHAPEGVEGTGLTTGDARPRQDDAYYADLAGPDWSALSFPADGSQTPVDDAMDPDPISYTPPVEPDPVVETPAEPDPVVEPPAEPDPVSYTPPAEPDPVVETPVEPDPVVETPPVLADPVDGTVLYRWNAGNATVAATDGGPDWVADSGALVGGTTNVSRGNISSLHATASQFSIPTAVFAQERWDPSAGAEMALEFGDGTLASGEYAVRLLMGNAFGGTATVGKRTFDVLVENESFLNDADLVASFGHQTGGVFQWTGEVTDGTIDIDFQRVIQNPLINGVEIVQLSTAPGDGAMDPISYTPPEEPDPVVETPVEPDPVSYTPPVEPDPVVETPSEPDPVVEPPAEPDPVSYTPPAEPDPVVETPVEPDPVVETPPVATNPADGTVLYRWNAGNATVAATDGGPDWVADSGALVGGATNIHGGNISSLHATASKFNIPTAVFAQERWDPSAGAEMALEFGDGTLASGEYAVRLLMGNAFGGTATVGKRKFDVLVENESFLNDADLVASFGHQTGGVFEWTGEVTDGTIDIDFQRVIQNPLINGVEIVQLSTTPGDTYTEVPDEDDYLTGASGFGSMDLIDSIS